MTTRLLKANGLPLVVPQGASCNITGTLVGPSDAAIALANLATFTLTLLNKATGAIINSRSAQDAKNANGHSVASDCAFTIELDANDNVIVVDVAAGQSEWHIARLAWTWSDGNSTRTGREDCEFRVEKLVAVVP